MSRLSFSFTRMLRTGLSTSVLGSALVLSIATSLPSNFLSAQADLEPVTLQADADSEERSWSARIDEALLSEGSSNWAAVAITICPLDETGAQLSNCDDPEESSQNNEEEEASENGETDAPPSDILPSAVTVELFAGDGVFPIASEVLTLGGDLTFFIEHFEFTDVEQRFTLRFTRYRSEDGVAPLEGEITLDASVSVSATFEELPTEIEENFDEFDLVLEGDLAATETEEDGNTELSEDEADDTED